MAQIVDLALALGPQHRRHSKKVLCARCSARRHCSAPAGLELHSQSLEYRHSGERIHCLHARSTANKCSVWRAKPESDDEARGRRPIRHFVRPIVRRARCGSGWRWNWGASFVCSLRQCQSGSYAAERAAPGTGCHCTEGCATNSGPCDLRHLLARSSHDRSRRRPGHTMGQEGAYTRERRGAHVDEREDAPMVHVGESISDYTSAICSYSYQCRRAGPQMVTRFTSADVTELSKSMTSDRLVKQAWAPPEF